MSGRARTARAPIAALGGTLLALAGACAGSHDDARSPRSTEHHAPAAGPSDRAEPERELPPDSEAPEPHASTDHAASDGASETPPAAPPTAHPPRGAEPDVALRVEPLGRGRASHVFDVAPPHECPLARVELDLEVVSMPDGRVVLTSPRGTSASLPLHVLTTTHFVRTWDWSRLDALHGERGREAAGPWRLEVALRGALYRGGDQPRAAPMPTPEYPRAELRVFCEPARRARDATSDEPIRVVRDVPPQRARPGASVRALLPVEEQCVIESVDVEIQDTAEGAIGVRWQLVTPDGAVLPLTGFRFGDPGEQRKIVASTRRPRGLDSAGLWELLAPRASGSTALRRAGLTIHCAAP